MEFNLGEGIFFKIKCFLEKNLVIEEFLLYSGCYADPERLKIPDQKHFARETLPYLVW